MVNECDASGCPARARVTILLRGGLLQFCGHHAATLRLPADAIVVSVDGKEEEAPPRRNHYQEMLEAMRAELDS